MFDNFEICFEPCYNGFDVAIYKNQELIEPKKCTNVSSLNPIDSLLISLEKALKQANKLYKKYGK